MSAAAGKRPAPEEMAAGRRVLELIRLAMAEPGYERRFEEWKMERRRSAEKMEAA